MGDFEGIPTELLHYVFLMACTDGGRTGCSLSLTSKFVRDTSRAARFHSVLILCRHPEALRRFLARIHADREISVTTQSNMPKVRHLYLASGRRKCAGDMYIEPSADEELQNFRQDVAALIELVAPDLVTFTLVHGGQHWTLELELPATIAVKAGFPNLEELTIVGGDLPFSEPFLPPADDAGDEVVPFPDLTHLHVFRCVGSYNFRDWSRRAPSLTHVRISDLTRGPSQQVLSYVRHMYCRSFSSRRSLCPISPTCFRGSPSGAAVSDVQDDPYFDNLRQFIIQPSSRACFNYREFMGRLEEAHCASGRQWTLVPPRPRPDEDEEEEAPAVKSALCDFKDRLTGGGGCWAVEGTSSSGNHGPDKCSDGSDNKVGEDM